MVLLLLLLPECRCCCWCWCWCCCSSPAEEEEEEKGGRASDRTMSLCETLCTINSIRRLPISSIPGHIPNACETLSCTSACGRSLSRKAEEEERLPLVIVDLRCVAVRGMKGVGGVWAVGVLLARGEERGEEAGLKSVVEEVS